MRAATREDLPLVLGLLEVHRLPTAGVQDHLKHFLLEFDQTELIACAGLEVHGQVGLLRSVAVDANYRSHGLGTKLVQAMLEQASMQHLLSISLLTETAQRYFPRFGFQITPRDALPTSLHASAEFHGACPDSAIAMTLLLDQSNSSNDSHA